MECCCLTDAYRPQSIREASKVRRPEDFPQSPQSGFAANRGGTGRTRGGAVSYRGGPSALVRLKRSRGTKMAGANDGINSPRPSLLEVMRPRVLSSATAPLFNAR